MPRTKKKHGAKTAFVRSLPTSLTAKEVVSKAKDAGITLTEKYVYNVRSSSNAGTPVKRKPGRPPGSVNRAPTRTAEDLLQAAAAEIGLSRAISLLQQRQQMVRSVLGR